MPATESPNGSIESAFLGRVQRYLASMRDVAEWDPALEADWVLFHEYGSRKIRAYAIRCGIHPQDAADCLQDVWGELLVRLPKFTLDPSRGAFDSWLFQIVKSKVVDLHRRSRRIVGWDQEVAASTAAATPTPDEVAESVDLLCAAWMKLRDRLSEINRQVFRLRIIEGLPAADVAKRLALTEEQVWYRLYRARKAAGEVESMLSADPKASSAKSDFLESAAQGSDACAVSPNVDWKLEWMPGGHTVDRVFQRLELGRRETQPEWKVEWPSEGTPRPVLFTRKMALVAYAEFCGPSELMAASWPRIATAAIAAGVAAGIATIIATPSAALPIFRSEFQRHLGGKTTGIDDILVALSAQHEASGPWVECG